MQRTSAAEAAIRDRISRNGRITFAEFMEMALYSAPGAYYGSERDKIGAAGDFFTSPEVHPAFGALLARQMEQVWVAMGRPPTFGIVEMGAGTGSLARDILIYSSERAPAFHRAISYTIVERSRSLMRVQQQTLSDPPDMAGRVIWQVTPSFEFGNRDMEGCLFSNELVDSLPVHRVMVKDGALMELYVEMLDGQLVETLGPVSDPRLEAYFQRVGARPEEGCRAEVNLQAIDWMVSVARVLSRGLILTLDYGYPADELYSRRHCDGTLLCFYRHTLNSDPFARIGQQDMTTHVDFSTLALVGKEHGLETLGITTQRSFLDSLGMRHYIELLPGLGLRHPDYDANFAALTELRKSDGLGRIKVLLQHRGLPGFDPAGLRAAGALHSDLGRALDNEPPPLLGPSHIRLTAPPETEPMMDMEGMWRELMGEDDEEAE